MKLTQNNEMYMANARIFHLLALGVGIGGNANFSIRFWGNAKFGIFKYQHVGIPNAKMSNWDSKPTRGPNANGFASQQNMGLKLHLSARSIMAQLSLK